MPRARPAILAAIAASVAAVVTAACGGPAQSGGHAGRGTFHPPDLGGVSDARPAPPIPAHGAYFGAWVRQGAYTQANQIAALDSLQGQLGRRLDIVHTYLTWQGLFPTVSDQVALGQGSMLLISWAGIDSAAVNSGRFDGVIRERAREFRALHRPVFLEWRWEMDRPNLRGFSGTPAEFIAAWRHVRAIFAQQHVRNVAWVWCPTAKGFGPGGDAAAYYPGDNEVDWTCADVYPGPGPYRSFADAAGPFLQWASHHRKPVMIGEFGVPQRYTSAQRAEWLRAAAQTVRSDPQVKALVYFDSGAATADPAYSMAIDPGSGPMQAFREMADSSYFDPRRLREGG